MFLAVGSLNSALPSLIESNSNNLTAEDFDRMAMDIRKKAIQQTYHGNESSDEEYKKAVRLSIIWKKGEDNTRLAHQLFEKLAESGNSKAAWQLGFDYEHGRGVKPDAQKAFYWYKKAADSGDLNGLYAVARCYYEGTGVPKDYKKALNTYLESAYRGEKNAFSMLSHMYWYGKGTTKDEIEALAWIYVEDANSNYDKSQKGINALNGLEREIGNRATLQAQQRAKEISNKISFKQ
jgi:TPR repeat protein